MNPHNFFAELKRRNVYKVAVAYVVVAWLLVQAASILFPTFEAPGWVMKVFVVIVAAGFPIALVIAWAFEMTPDGMKRTENVGPNEYIPQWSARTFAALIISIALLAGGLFLWQNVRSKSSSAPPSSASAAFDKSIAVLPFLNEGGDPANEYFSDGLSEELIAALAQNGDLKVIGRSSSFRFKGKNEESKTIGEKLGVSTLLEGTVRKQNNEVRIVAELVNAADGRELWSQTFNRALKDIFGVQADIAKAVAGSLKVTLLGKQEGPTRANATENVEAHNAYFEGHFYLVRHSDADYRKAITFFDQAIRLDPNYALAYAERSESWAWVGDQSAGAEQTECWAKGRSDAEKSVAIDPNLAEARASLGWLRVFVDWKFTEGLAQLRRAKELSPGSVAVDTKLSFAVYYLGHTTEAEALAKRSVELDPLSYPARGNLARVLVAAGKLDEAAEVARQGVELQPNAAAGHRVQVIVATIHGDGETALREAQLEPNDSYRHFELALAYQVRGDRPAADAALAELIAKDRSVEAYQIAQVYAVRHETEKVFEWLQIAFDQHDTGILSLLIDPLMRELHQDPRYHDFLVKVGLPTSI